MLTRSHTAPLVHGGGGVVQAGRRMQGVVHEGRRTPDRARGSSRWVLHT